jgi:hypothetical protein
MIRESSQKEIVVSKIIIGILSIYVVYWLGINLSSNGQWVILHFKNKNYFAGTIMIFVCLAILIFQIIALTQMLKNKKSKYNFKNFQRNFHPFFKDENQEYKLSGYIFLLVVIFLFHILIPLIVNYFSKDGLGFNIPTLFAFYAHVAILSEAHDRNNTLDKLPVKLMQKHKISLILPYEDYINKKIVDDEPHLQLNQSFEFTVKKVPRTESEKATIEIKNNNTPNNPALISSIEDSDLANIIRNGGAVKSRLISIGEFAKLEIELSIDKVTSSTF